LMSSRGKIAIGSQSPVLWLFHKSPRGEWEIIENYFDPNAADKKGRPNYA